MNKMLFIVLAVFLGIASGCGGEDSSPTENFTYSDPTEAQLQEVLTEWQSRDLLARDIELLLTDSSANDFEVRIYRHRVRENVHYGLVTIPKAANDEGYAVVIYADGLDQSNPDIDLRLWVDRAKARLNQAIFVVPLFRGRTLTYENLHLEATGDFCDAYDGATDDAIALLNVVEAEIDSADLSRVMVRGGSRGGNVALLMGVRDPRITVVAAASAPVDFYRDSVRQQYGSQYHCQFFAGKNIDQSRRRMLASSPIYFDMATNVDVIYLDHGTDDSVVPVWNSDEMAQHLIELGFTVNYSRYPGMGHDLSKSNEFNRKQQLIYDEFLESENTIDSSAWQSR